MLSYVSKKTIFFCGSKNSRSKHKIERKKINLFFWLIETNEIVINKSEIATAS